MSKLDEMPSELENLPAGQPVEEKPFDAEEFLNSRTDDRRAGYEERVQEIAEERGLGAEAIIESDAYREKSAREGAGIEHSRGYAERVINSDLTYEYLPDTDGLLFKGDIDGKNYEIEKGSSKVVWFV